MDTTSFLTKVFSTSSTSAHRCKRRTRISLCVTLIPYVYQLQTLQFLFAYRFGGPKNHAEECSITHLAAISGFKVESPQSLHSSPMMMSSHILTFSSHLFSPPASLLSLLSSRFSLLSLFSLRVSFLELYNEELQDLLASDKSKTLKLCEDSKKVQCIRSLILIPPYSPSS